MKYVYLLSILPLVFSLVTKENSKSSISHLEVTKHQEKKSQTQIYYEIVSASGSILVAGLGDRSFFITTIMAIKYNKWIVLISATLSLTLMGFISVELGLTLTQYVPAYCIDIAGFLAFFLFGLNMIGHALKEKKILEMEQSNEITRQINKNILDEINQQIESKQKEELNTLSNQKSNTEDYRTIMKTAGVFMEIFVLVFFSELGDKSQISTIYLSPNFNPMVLFCSVVVSQFLLTVMAVFCGKLIAERIAEHTLELISGALFIAFGVISMYITYLHDYVIISNLFHRTHEDIGTFSQKIPLRTNSLK